MKKQPDETVTHSAVMYLAVEKIGYIPNHMIDKYACSTWLLAESEVLQSIGGDIIKIVIENIRRLDLGWGG